MQYTDDFSFSIDSSAVENTDDFTSAWIPVQYTDDLPWLRFGAVYGRLSVSVGC